jgi:trimethylamine monooxygenase
VKSEGQLYEELFDNVIVASGHFSTPNMPEFPGIQNFAGLVMHSHDFRNGSAFKGKNVVIVGASCSAEDIASQCHKFGAKNVIITHRKKDETGNWCKTHYEWPSGIEEKPLMRGFEHENVEFGDGEKV